MIFGIDYGSKLAGTTVIAYSENDTIKTVSSQKKQNADQFILDFVEKVKPTLIGIDAPLSLPAAFYGKGDDYFYREADKKLKAMSPMFLGGLTARAIKLKSQISADMIEVYPGGLSRNLELAQFEYKKKEADYEAMMNKLDWTSELKSTPKNSHEFDAILALFITWRAKNNLAQKVGDPDEGLIYY